jgi:hypothetical protein
MVAMLAFISVMRARAAEAGPGEGLLESRLAVHRL